MQHKNQKVVALPSSLANHEEREIIVWPIEIEWDSHQMKQMERKTNSLI